MCTGRIARILGWLGGILTGLVLVVAVSGFFLVRGFVEPDVDRFGMVSDEAKAANRTADSLKAAGEPYYAAMDKGLLEKPADRASYPPEIIEVAKITGLEPEAVRLAAFRGQNMWIAWPAATIGSGTGRRAPPLAPSTL